MLTISLIVAMAANGCIGHNNDLPWHIPQDLKRFKALTTGHPVIMGRKTWESITTRLGGPLPGRENIVLSRNNSPPHSVGTGGGITGAISLESALEDRLGEIFIIGGAQVYALSLPVAHKIYLTRVHQTVEGDAFFPVIQSQDWEETACEDYEGFSFITLVRRCVSIK